MTDEVYDQDKDPQTVADQIETRIAPINDGQTIWKFPIKLDGGVTSIPLPATSKLLAVQTDEMTDEPAIWIQLNPKHPEARTLVLQVIVTGGAVPFGEYLGTFQTTDTGGMNFVGHVYGLWQ